MDKEISESIEPYQEYMLKDLDEQDEGHYHDHDETARTTLWQKTYWSEQKCTCDDGQETRSEETRPGKVVEGSIRTTARSSVATT
jgi:hypothetical protein